MKNKKKPVLLTAALTAALSLLFVSACSRTGSRTADLNLLLITLDTTRADYIGAYGHPAVSTPNLDALCREGVMFQNCYSPAPLTLPAHCAIFTGKYPIGHGARNNSSYYLINDENILARLLGKKGFHTFAVIAAYVLIAKFGVNQGFDIYDDAISTSEITADAVYKKFKNWFAANKQGKFFSWVHFYDPHDPYKPPAEYIVKGSEDDNLKLYAGEIEFVDKYVGKIIADLETAGILDKTLVIIVGDHGEAFGEHNEFGHSIFCYEENLKVPLIFYNKSMFKKRSITQRVNLVDIMPTILDTLDMPIPAGVQGKSFLGMMRGKEEAAPRTFFIESIYGKEEMNWAPLTGLIAGDYKYISLPEPELYNLVNDKNERNNLFKKEFNTAKKYDAQLKESILALADPASTEKAKRELSTEDIRHLKALGYIPAFSGKNKEDSLVDPKRGVIVDNKLKKFKQQIKKGENLDAIEIELKKLLVETPEFKSPLVYLNLHDIYKAQNKPAAALRILETGVKEYPDIYQFRYRLASFLFRLKKYDEAFAHCRLILKDNPLYAQVYAMLGNIYLRRGNFAEAERNFQEGLRLEPGYVLLKREYAELLMMLKKYKEAVEIYNTLLAAEETSGDQDFLFNVALLNARYGDMTTAGKILQRLVKLKPCGKYHFYYAVMLAKNRELRAAIENMAIALERYAGELTAAQQQQAAAALAAWKKGLKP